MHIEILAEDSSGERLLSIILPKILGDNGGLHSWRIHPYRGVGRIPKNLGAGGDPAKRILLDQLPRLLVGYGKTPGIDAVVVVLDADKRNCSEFLIELRALAETCNPKPNTLFRLAIEEIEAWYFGDKPALTNAYPRAKTEVLKHYVQDSPCNTWELLADAVYPGGSAAIMKAGWPLPGQIKHEWAETIGPLLEIEHNQSPSFQKLLYGLRQLTMHTI